VRRKIIEKFRSGAGEIPSCGTERVRERVRPYQLALLLSLARAVCRSYVLGCNCVLYFTVQFIACNGEQKQLKL